MFVTILNILFITAIIIQLVYALYFFARIFQNHTATVKQDPRATRLPISLVICAHNEAHNLQHTLPLIFAQRYISETPFSEVIVVNDNSTDNTAAILENFRQAFPVLKIVTITPETPRLVKGKKFALSFGVAAASHEWLVFMDADCAPASENWLSEMAVPFCNGKKIVAGYGGFYTKKGLLNTFVRWETLHTFLQYATYAWAGKPYMAVGRNMACAKNTWLQAQQSEVWNQLPSGDDDLLMSTMANRENTTIVYTKKSFTYSDSPATWQQWISQKQRHLSTGKYYKPLIKILLGGYAMSHALCWLLFAMMLCMGFYGWAIGLMGLRCLLYWLAWYRSAVLLNEKKLWFFFPLFDFGWMIYNFAFSPYILWKNKQQWK